MCIDKEIIFTHQNGNEFIPLKICTFNAQGLTNKFAQFKDFIFQHNPDILVVTETHFNEDVLNSEFCPPGYVCFRKDRKLHFYTEGTYTQSNRGGVLILVKSFLNPTPYTEGDVDAEILWVNINPQPKVSWLIGGCYRTEEDEEQILTKINSYIDKINTDNCILLGDFNLRRVDWEAQTSSRALDQSFIDTVSENLLHQIVSEPTRG